MTITFDLNFFCLKFKEIGVIEEALALIIHKHTTKVQILSAIMALLIFPPWLMKDKKAIQILHLESRRSMCNLRAVKVFTLENSTR